MYFILFIAIAVASYAVQSSLKSKFSTYSKTPLSNGMTGAQVAEKMLRDNGINNVKVTQIEGQLTDHYNPATLTVNLLTSTMGHPNQEFGKRGLINC